MFCKKCGNKLEIDEKFCGKCGTSVDLSKELENNDRKSTKNKVIKIYQVIFCIILIVCIGIIVVTQTQNSIGDSSLIQKEKQLNTYWNYDENGNITNGEMTLKIGDYINYDEQTGATQLGYISEESKNGFKQQSFYLSSYEYGWRVLGAENGQIMLISEDPIGPSKGYTYESDKRMYFFLEGMTGAINAKAELDSIAQLYGQGKGADKARSINVNDINRLTGYKPKGENLSYDYAPNTLGMDTESVEYELLFKNNEINSRISDDLKGATLGCNYWLASTFNSIVMGCDARCVRYVSSGYISYEMLSLVSDKASSPSKDRACVRPVVYLKNTVQLKETSDGVYNIEI